MSGIRKIPWAVALALGAGEAWALGLGSIEVRSALNEPLNAEILLTAADAEEIASLKVALATPEDFERVGLRRSLLTVPLEFAVGRNERGQPVVKVTSKAAVRDPFLTVLVDAQWSGGRMLREYTMLLDPPLTAPAVRGTSAATPARLPEPAPGRVESLPEDTAADAPRPRPVTEPSRPAAAPASQPQSADRPAAAYSGAEYGPVAEGETLWVIASNTRPGDDINVNQMMMALYRANPEAFINNNINLLRRGAILRIPPADEVRATSSREAAEMVARQTAQWMESRGERALPRIEPSEAMPSSAATPRREPAPRRDDRLAILPPGDDQRPDAGETRPGVSADSVEIEGLRADLSRSRESLTAAEQEVRELRGRVRELESLQSDQERLLALKDGELADLQRRLAELESVTDAPDSALPDVATDVDADADAVAAADAGADDSLDSEAGSSDPFERLEREADRAAARETGTQVSEPDAETGSVAEPAATAAAPVEPERPARSERSSAPPPAPPPSTPWYSSPYLLGGVAVVMAVLLALVARRRKSGAAARGEGGNLASRLVAASGSTTGGAASADDPLAELQALVAEDPSDLSAHLALLRHRYEQRDAAGFEADAEAMSGFVTDTAAPEWDEVRMMGADLAPEHPLFRDPTAGDVEAEPDFAEAFDFSEGDDDQASAEDVSAEPEPFSIDLGGELDQASHEVEAPTADAEAEADFEPSFEALPADEPGLGKDEDDGDSYSTQQFAAVDLEAALGSGEGGDGLSLDSGGDDAVGTKLDLAREYLDLGDPEGARSLLEEVLKEGSAAQKAEAQRLMVQIR